MTSFTLVRNTRKVPLKEVQRVAKAIEHQLRRDVCPAWGVAPDVILQVLDAPDENYFRAGVRNEPITWPEGTGLDSTPVFLCEGEMPPFGGYHHRSGAGVPYAVVFVEKKNWSIYASHEMIETLLNPQCELELEGPIPGSPGDVAWYLQEVCGPCQHRAFAYRVDGVDVSDFVFPAWFDQGAKGGRFDHCEKISAPFQLLSDGYVVWRNPAGYMFETWRTKQGLSTTPLKRWPATAAAAATTEQ